jgi:hypothetical protein
MVIRIELGEQKVLLLLLTFMSEYSFTYRNDNYSPERAKNATLFVKAGKTAISFLIEQDGQLMAWKDNCPLSELADNGELNTLLTAPYKRVVTGLAPDALTLVPSELYQPEHIADYARYLDIQPEEKVFVAKLNGENQLVYKTSATDALAAKFDIEKSVPADRGWIATVAKNEPSNYAIYADIADGQVSLVNFNGGKVRLYNCFKAQSAEDVLYYCLFAANQLDMKPDYTSLIISGHTAGGDLEKLGEFFRLVKYNDLKVLEVPYGVPSHQLLSLVALA